MRFFHECSEDHESIADNARTLHKLPEHKIRRVPGPLMAVCPADSMTGQCVYDIRNLSGSCIFSIYLTYPTKSSTTIY
jgi:hypothetical protein